MHPLNPVIANAVIDEIALQRQDAAARAVARRDRRRSPFGGLRRRAAARRDRSPAAISGPHMPAGAGPV
jgi:hypothetical protein